MSLPKHTEWQVSPRRDRRSVKRPETVDLPPSAVIEWSVEIERGVLSKGVGPPRPWESGSRAYQFQVAWGPSICVLGYDSSQSGELAAVRHGFHGWLGDIRLSVIQPAFGFRRQRRILQIDAEDGRQWQTRLHEGMQYVLIRAGDDKPVWRGARNVAFMRRTPIAWRNDATDDELVLGASLENIAGMMRFFKYINF